MMCDDCLLLRVTVYSFLFSPSGLQDGKRIKPPTLICQPRHRPLAFSPLRPPLFFFLLCKRNRHTTNCLLLLARFRCLSFFPFLFKVRVLFLNQKRKYFHGGFGEYRSLPFCCFSSFSLGVGFLFS
ncbi:hypothetical protein DFP73DRAFT_25742 [Morchella snyderi]|nr:hypothetical protein DFP73DRAFT_25742 [Morchella snyderi]